MCQEIVNNALTMVRSLMPLGSVIYELPGISCMLILTIKVTIKVTFGIGQKRIHYQADQNLFPLVLCFVD